MIPVYECKPANRIASLLLNSCLGVPLFGWDTAIVNHHAQILYDVVEKKTSTRRRSRLPCVVVETMRCVDVKTAASSSKENKKVNQHLINIL